MYSQGTDDRRPKLLYGMLSVRNQQLQVTFRHRHPYRSGTERENLCYYTME